MAGLVCLIVVLSISYGIFLGPITPGIRKARESAAMQTSRTIALAMFQFSNDNGGKYPNGRSSTEVFQKLIDGNYISEPSIFFVQMAGKAEATSKTLKPENVSYDVTIPIESDSPAGLPLVFLTGYRVDYRAGGSAIPLSDNSTAFGIDGSAVCYKSGDAWFRVPKSIQGSGGVIQNFVPTDFDSKGQNYQQLTPTGQMSPP